jgi:hypothetical protein
MRWFKHLSRAHKDPKLLALIERGDYEAYGLYWRLVEEIAENLPIKSDRPALRHTENGWAQILQISVRKFRRLVFSLAGEYLIDRRIIGGSSPDQIEIEVCKLLKYRDEGRKKSEVTSEQLPTNYKHKTKETKESKYSTDSVEYSELEIKQALNTLPPPPLGGEARAKPKPKRELVSEPETDVIPEHWGALLSVATLAGLQWSTAIEPKLLAMWAKIPIDERLIAIEGISLRVDTGEYADPAFVPKLRRYLEERLWTERVRPPPKKLASIEDRNVIALRKFAERYVREGVCNENRKPG